MSQKDRLRRARAELYGRGELERAESEAKRTPEEAARLAHALMVANGIRARYGLMGAVSMHKHGRKPIKPRWQDHVERVRGNDD